MFGGSDASDSERLLACVWARTWKVQDIDQSAHGARGSHLLKRGVEE